MLLPLYTGVNVKPPDWHGATAAFPLWTTPARVTGPAAAA
jgi:hypothetical protein